MLHFYTPWKHQKTFGFLMFSGAGGGGGGGGGGGVRKGTLG